jgi:DNA invertase Pin-like site-specific DNA recombinase
MKGRYKPPISETTSFESSLSSLPTNRPVAVYYRQSTTAQVGNVSTFIQTIDIPALLKARGWKEDQIIMIDADEGVSGQTKIDEREGMKNLFSLITSGAIGTVACQDEDRLFRDVTQIQVNIFIEACRANRVLVLTPTMTYDFGHKDMGTFHARQFRFKSEMAADYITTVIKGKLHTAKLRMMHEGRWAGGNVPIGFMIDQRKTIDGVPNPNWRKYVEFEPYSAVVKQWYALFVELNGNLRRTQITIEQRRLFPDLSVTIPEGFYYKKPSRLLPSSAALSYTLCNVAYIGHWAVQGRVVIRNNHQAIVPVATFMRAFNHLSTLGFDGNENKAYSPYRENARPMKEAERLVEKPLLSGLMFTPYQDDWATVGTHYDAKWGKYRYYFHAYHGVRTYEWSKNAAEVDVAVSEVLHIKMSATFQSEQWERSMKAAQEKMGQDKGLIEQQLKSLETVIDGHTKRISVLTNETLIQNVEKEYLASIAEKERLVKLLDEMAHEQNSTEQLLCMKESFQEASVKWETQSREEKQRVLHAFIDWIDTRWEKQHLCLTIHWKDGSTDTVYCRKTTGSGEVWLPEEDTELVQLVRNGALQVEIIRTFPKRTWCSITERMRTIMPGEKRPRYIRVIGRTMTFEQFQSQAYMTSESESPFRVLRVLLRFRRAFNSSLR